MIKLDPIIAVRNIQTSARWYRQVFGCRSTGIHLITLVAESGEVLLCLHPWGEHGHPTMQEPEIGAGHGLILYFRTDNLDGIRKNVEMLNYAVEEEIHVNPNSRKKEFSLRDPDGYYLTITEFHTY